MLQVQYPTDEGQDEAFRENQDKRLRRARTFFFLCEEGAGRTTYSAPLQGSIQTRQRAEVAVVLHAVLAEKVDVCMKLLDAVFAGCDGASQ